MTTLRNRVEPCREYRAVHDRLRRERGPARGYLCDRCGEPALDWAFQYPEGRIEVCPDTRRRFSSDPADYLPLCRSCHLRMDWEKDPEMAARTNSRRFQCGGCDLGKHQRATGHIDRKEATS